MYVNLTYARGPTFTMPLTFTPEETLRLPPVLSAPRFATYLRACKGSRSRALALYRWNMQISAAFMLPLSVIEVVTRNAIAEAIQAHHGLAWPGSAGFAASLPSRGRFNDLAELQDVARRYGDVGQVVAHLSFSFWQKRLTVRHLPDIWQGDLWTTFPGLPLHLTPSGALVTLHNEIERVRNLRNRIAHHEPIFSRALQDEYDRIIRVIGYRSSEAAGWVDRVQGVTALLAAAP